MEKFKKRHKQLTSLVLSAAMIFSLVPGTVGANHNIHSYSKCTSNADPAAFFTKFFLITIVTIPFTCNLLQICYISLQIITTLLNFVK